MKTKEKLLYKTNLWVFEITVNVNWITQLKRQIDYAISEIIHIYKNWDTTLKYDWLYLSFKLLKKWA